MSVKTARIPNVPIRSVFMENSRSKNPILPFNSLTTASIGSYILPFLPIKKRIRSTDQLNKINYPDEYETEWIVKCHW
jgi:hypothetical protein